MEMKTVKSPKNLSRVIADAVISLNKKECLLRLYEYDKVVEIRNAKEAELFRKTRHRRRTNFQNKSQMDFSFDRKYSIMIFDRGSF